MVTLATEQIAVATNKRLCKCNCGELIDKYDKYGIERFYKNHHYQKDIRRRKGEDHPNYNGDNVGYFALHDYVNRHKSRPLDGLCEFCGMKPYKQLACITGLYNREFSNWKYLCHRCHVRHDMKRSGLLIPADRRCVKCGSNKTTIHKDGRAIWRVIDKQNNLYQCKNCSNHEYRHKKKQKIKLTLDNYILSSPHHGNSIIQRSS